MHPLLRRVSRLQQLAVFECAARLESFTAAAAELGLSQPAVSRHMIGLERAIGLQLFQRGANRVKLTPAGSTLLAAIQEGFDIIDLALGDARAEDSTFLLAANPGFAQHRLVPLLEDLQSAIGQNDLRLRLFDRDSELEREHYDAAIHLAPRSTSPAGSILLFDEVVVPVATPDFAASARLDSGTAPASLISLPKLHLDGRDRCWMEWSTWFAAHGISWSAGGGYVSYNNYPLVLNDALAGRGVALAWRGLIDDLLDRGDLVPVGPEVHRPEMAYQLIVGSATRRDVVDRLADWLLRDHQ